MFKSGSNKQPEPKNRWAIQVLTTEYLIDGYDESDQGLMAGWETFFLSENFEIGPLTSVQVQPTGNLTAPLQSFSKWDLARRELVVAVIPRDEAGLKMARKASSKYKHAFQTVLYAGPYIVRGMWMEAGTDPEFELSRGGDAILLTEAAIDCQLPGTKLTGLTAPWLFVNIHLVHGLSIA
jgi:hypothetical protein